MSTTVPRTPTIDALEGVWAAIATLLADLEDADWLVATDLPGWNVQSNVSHIIGTEAMLLGEAAPEVDVDVKGLPHVRNDIAAFNETWIVALADADPEEMRERFGDVTARRIEALRAMGDEEWDTVGFTPVGEDTYGRFMRVRTFDSWMHEHDIRSALGLEDRIDPAAMALAMDEMVPSLGYVVGKKAGAPAGAMVTFEFTGPAGRTVHVEVGERAAIVEALPGPADTTITTDVMTFARLGGGRFTYEDVADEVRIDGDRALAHSILANMAFTI